MMLLPIPYALVQQAPQPDLLRLPELTASLKALLPKLQSVAKSKGGYVLTQVIAPKNEFDSATLIWSSQGRTDLEMRLLWPRDIATTTERLYLSTVLKREFSPEESKTIAQELDASIRTKEFKLAPLPSKRARLENKFNVLSDKPEKIVQEMDALFALAKKYDVAPSDADPTPAERQKSVLAAFQKAGFQSGEPEAIPETIGNSVEIPLTKAGERFVLTVNDFYMTIARLLPRADVSDVAKEKLTASLKEKFPKVTARFGTAELALELLESIDDATPTRLMAMLEEVQRAAKLVPDSGLSAPTPAPTDAMGATLRLAGLPAKNAGSFYSIRYDFIDTKRSQAAYIRKQVDSYNSLKIHEIFSIFYDAKDAPSAELLQKVFQKRFSIGGLVLEAPSASQPNWRIRFRIDASADISTERLKTFTNLTASTADALEKEFLAEDKVH